MAQTTNSKKIQQKINSKTGISSLIIFVVLLLAWIAGFSSRLFAVIRFESIIHEFDPWLEQILIFFYTFYTNICLVGSTTGRQPIW